MIIETGTDRRERHGGVRGRRARPFPGVAGSADGLSHGAADSRDWERLDRFLRLGAETGPYRVGQPEPLMSLEGAALRCIRTDASQVVGRVIALAEQGRAPVPGAGILVLAWVTAVGDDEGRSAACAGVPRVCRTAGDLFLFAEKVTELRGWGRGLRRAVGNWYCHRYAEDLAYQVVKCPRRGAWSHRDLLRLAHPTPVTREQAAVFRWILGGAESLGRRTVVRALSEPRIERGGEGGIEEAAAGVPRRVRSVTYPGVGELPRLLQGVEDARRASSREEVVRLIAEHNLPREAIPAAWLGDPAVWDALLHRMPLEGLIRDLGSLAGVGLIAPGSEAAWWIQNRLQDAELLRASGLHPMAFLLARRAYEQGGARSARVTWKPVSSVVQALEHAFYAAFRNVPATCRSTLVALDLSASTRRACLPGSGLTVHEASAAMALVQVSTEPGCVVTGLTDPLGGTLGGGLTLLDIVPGMRLEEVMARLAEVPAGAPDCALPMRWAERHGLPVDSFVLYSDGELWASDEFTPARALLRYRTSMGRPAKCVVAGMSGVPFEAADPGDPGMLDVQGFDARTASVIAGFLSEGTGGIRVPSPTS